MSVVRVLAALLLPALLPVGASAQTITTTDVPVLAHMVARGDLLSAADFAPEPRTPAQARGALALVDVAGKEAARNMPAGTVVRGSDVLPPRLVRRGEPVMIAVRSGALTIGTAGRALANGGAGDLVRVVALSTNRTLDALVDGPGRVRIIAP